MDLYEKIGVDKKFGSGNHKNWTTKNPMTEATTEAKRQTSQIDGSDTEAGWRIARSIWIAVQGMKSVDPKLLEMQIAIGKQIVKRARGSTRTMELRKMRKVS